MKYFTKYKKYTEWLRIIFSFIFFFITSVLYFNSKIILKNKFESTHNYIYIIENKNGCNKIDNK